MGIPLAVLSRSDEHAAAINSALRDVGHPVHCARVNGQADFEALLAGDTPELVLLFQGASDLPLDVVATMLAGCSPRPPLLLVASRVDEPLIAAAMEAGARDVVSLTHRNRLQAVITRELEAGRLQRALDGVLCSARQYKQEFHSLLSAASAAIVEVQEGIVTVANPAWATLLGWDDAGALVGHPFMDLFREADRGALKGALVACRRGRWQESTPLPVVARRSNAAELPLQLVLRSITSDGEPAVRITVAAAEDAATPPAEALAAAVATDPATGFLSRQPFVEGLVAALARPPAEGLQALAFIRPDHFAKVQAEVGTLASEELLACLAGVIRELAQPGDLCGRFGGTLFTVLLERGTLSDVRAWAGQVCKAVAGRVFELGARSTSLTCTVGISEARGQSAVALVDDAAGACAAGRDQGGNRVLVSDRSSMTERLRQTDGFWVARIRSALLQNRLRLVHQPIVALQEELQGVVDTRVRLIDEQGEIIRPTEFMPAAERAHLMKNIDRWVIGASFAFCTASQPGLVFIRLSRDSVLDETLPDWLRARAAGAQLRGGQVCFQVSEELALQQLGQVKALAAVLQSAGFLFAVDHLGTGRESLQLLDHIPLQFVKIDGSLMQGLARDKELQRRVGDIASRAAALGVKTIAERVGDASTLAMLWQLGVAFVQGNFTQTHGVVLAAGDEAGAQAAG